MDAITKRNILLGCAVCGLVVLVVACSSVYRAISFSDDTVYVYENQSVLYADGPFCPWAPGLRGCPKVYPAGVYLINEKGEVIKPDSKASLVPYKPQKHRGCEGYQTTSQGNQAISCGPNFFVSLERTNDTLWETLWGLQDKGMRISEAWKSQSVAPRVKVAVIDTGVAYDHPDIGGQVVAGYDAVTGAEGLHEGRDVQGHGTHVAGTICATGGNEEGITGVAQACQIYAARFLGDDGSGSLFGAARAIDWAIRMNVHIINASWGGPGNSEVLEKAVKKANEAGILFLAAAGNNGKDLGTFPQYPARYNYTNMYTIGSHDKNGSRSYFSNYGDAVEAMAPGSQIMSLNYLGGYMSLSGTSMATPHVAGLAALYWEDVLDQGDKRSQMLSVISKLNEGIVDGKMKAHSKQNFCDQNGCKKCFKKCNRRFEKKHLRRRCKRACRELLNCKKRCR